MRHVKRSSTLESACFARRADKRRRALREDFTVKTSRYALLSFAWRWASLSRRTTGARLCGLLKELPGLGWHLFRRSLLELSQILARILCILLTAGQNTARRQHAADRRQDYQSLPNLHMHRI